jgi:TolB protein
VGEVRPYVGAVLSRDGKTVATSLADADGRVADIWLVDLTRDNLITRLTFEPSVEADPAWSPDGKQLVFGSNRSGGGKIDLYLKAAGGASNDQLVFSSDSTKFPTSWSRDGKFILFENWAPKSKGAIWTLSLVDNKARSPVSNHCL